MPVTLWYVWDNKINQYVFNHLEDGHVEDEYPQPKSPAFSAQKGWVNGTWWRKHGLLDRNNVVVTIE